MSKQQTALTKFFDKIRVRFDKDSEEYEQLVTDYVLAKADEKQQIINHHAWLLSGVMSEEAAIKDAEQYYNDKYGQ